MSTGLECWTFESEFGRWYYVLQSVFCPVGAWDWTDENPIVVGPFSDEDAALAHLRRHHANPGGYTTIAYGTSSAATMAKLVVLAAKAARP